MAKLVSHPKAPHLALPAPVATPDPTANEPLSGSSADISPEVTEDAQRLDAILTRRRGRLGTVATSFSGVGVTDLPTRKTLLGE